MVSKTELDDSGRKMPQKNPELRAAILELAKLQPRADNLDRSEVKKFYFKTKQVVAEAEKINNQCIILYHRNDAFWQMGDNSALIYYYRLSRQMGLDKVKFKLDNDYCKTKWKLGCVMVAKIENVVKRLEEQECRLAVDTDEVKVLILPKKISDEELDVWANSREEKQARFNSQTMPKVTYAKIFQKINMLHREVVNKVVDLPPPRREAYGNIGLEIVTWLTMNAIGMMNGRMLEEDFFEEALDRLGVLNDWMVMIEKFDVFDIDASLRVIKTMVELREEVQMELKILEKKKAKL